MRLGGGWSEQQARNFGIYSLGNEKVIKNLGQTKDIVGLLENESDRNLSLH